MSSSAPLYRTDWPVTAGLIQRFGVDGVKLERRAEFEKYVQHEWFPHKDKYIAVERATRVPAPLIYCFNKRESECDWNAYIGNGEKLDHRTTLVPEGRGPFCRSLPASLDEFIAGAHDAFAIDGLSAVMQDGDVWVLGQRWGSFPIEKMIYYGEKLNGWGYRWHGIPSPYVWGGTIVQKPGKYVSDGQFSAGTWDTQPGIAPLLWTLGHLDDTVHFTRES